MIAVELLVVLGLFAIVVVRGAHQGAGALVGAVGQDEDLPREADRRCRGHGPRSDRACVLAVRGRTTGVCHPEGQ